MFISKILMLETRTHREGKGVRGTSKRLLVDKDVVVSHHLNWLLRLQTQ